MKSRAIILGLVIFSAAPSAFAFSIRPERACTTTATSKAGEVYMAAWQVLVSAHVLKTAPGVSCYREGHEYFTVEGRTIYSNWRRSGYDSICENRKKMDINSQSENLRKGALQLRGLAIDLGLKINLPSATAGMFTSWASFANEWEDAIHSLLGTTVYERIAKKASQVDYRYTPLREAPPITENRKPLVSVVGEATKTECGTTEGIMY